MPSQMNHDKGPNRYRTAEKGKATVTKAQTNYDDGRTTKKGGGSASRQMNFDIKSKIEVKTVSSHFGEKSGTGCNDGY